MYSGCVSCPRVKFWVDAKVSMASQRVRVSGKQACQSSRRQAPIYQHEHYTMGHLLVLHSVTSRHPLPPPPRVLTSFHSLAPCRARALFFPLLGGATHLMNACQGAIQCLARIGAQAVPEVDSVRGFSGRGGRESRWGAALPQGRGWSFPSRERAGPSLQVRAEQ